MECVHELIRATDYRPSAVDKNKLSNLLNEFHDTLSVDEYGMGQTGIIEHHIDNVQHPPIHQALRRHPPSHLQAVREQTELMLKQNNIEPSVSGWTSNLVLVRRKDNTLRFCVDYRRLNEISQNNAYPLPRIDTCLDAMNGARRISTFNFQSGFHQVLMDEESRDKTPFVTRERTFRFCVMPFGLTGAPATFQRLMDVVMSELNLEVWLVYLVDIIVYSADVDTHLERLRAVYGRLQAAGLKLNPSKCRLFQRRVRFLGHIVSEGGTATDPEKVQAVATWPPQNVYVTFGALLVYAVITAAS